MLQPNAGNFGAAFMIPGVNMDLRKPYEVTALPGKFKRTTYTVEHSEITLRNGTKKMRSKLVPKQVMEDAGYLVKFPNGHSIRVSSKEELQRLGFDADPGIVDMLSGQVFMPNMKHVAQQMELLTLLSPDYISGADQMTKSSVAGESINLEEGGIKRAAGKGKGKPKPATGTKSKPSTKKGGR